MSSLEESWNAAKVRRAGGAALLALLAASVATVRVQKTPEAVQATIAANKDAYEAFCKANPVGDADRAIVTGTPIVPGWTTQEDCMRSQALHSPERLAAFTSMAVSANALMLSLLVPVMTRRIQRFFPENAPDHPEALTPET